MESVAGVGIGEDAHFVLSGDQMHGYDVEASFQRTELVVTRGDFRPNLSAQRIERLGGRALKQKLAIGNDGHARTKFANVLDDVSGEDDGNVGTDAAEQIEKAVA